MENSIHIITHDVPYPADFGGVIDIFYKIKWLYKTGVKIHLHCFKNIRPAQTELNKYCETVTYYKRKKITALSFCIPFIVTSRKNSTLLQNLKKDNYPILFEGIHTTYYLYKNEFENRKTFLRLFNVEHIYYDTLAKNESNIFKKLYFLIESKLLKKYELSIANKTKILTLSTQDLDIYNTFFSAKDVAFLPVFLPYNNIASHAGKGKYCLYHGNLDVNENTEVVLWLMQNVFNTLQIPFIIAGKKPSKKLLNSAKKYKNISIVPSPTEENMQLLIANAQINILPSFNKTGVKLKLLNALYNGRHCLVNIAGVSGSGLNTFCHIADTSKDYIIKIEQLFAEDFTQKEMQHRSTALKNIYDNNKNALFIQELLH
ncbi:MAG: glycosyltransferase [Ferruginibacter sp.]|nr:glycosyltransferase [Ferruginibacter sp.]